MVSRGGGGKGIAAVVCRSDIKVLKFLIDEDKRKEERLKDFVFWDVDDVRSAMSAKFEFMQQHMYCTVP